MRISLVACFVAMNFVIVPFATWLPAYHDFTAHFATLLPGIFIDCCFLSSTEAMSSLKVTYFNAAGRAELTRLLFKIGGVAFEDERLSGVSRVHPQTTTLLLSGTIG
jgi:hypothetical protein